MGTLCNLTKKKEHGRASIRVNEIYNDLDDTGAWADKPHLKAGEYLLVFITSSKHVNGLDLMNDHPQKHVGILIGDKVYNYSNPHHRVEAEPIDHFFSKCDNAYDGDDISLYYGVVQSSQG
jgi:hypothetical protein